MEGNDFRLIYVPGAEEVPDPRKWKVGFWKYFHIRSTCVRHARRLLEPDDDMGVECALLPKKFGEALEMYR